LSVTENRPAFLPFHLSQITAARCEKKFRKLADITTSQKTRQQTAVHVHIFARYWVIFRVISPRNPIKICNKTIIIYRSHVERITTPHNKHKPHQVLIEPSYKTYADNRQATDAQPADNLNQYAHQ